MISQQQQQQQQPIAPISQPAPEQDPYTLPPEELNRLLVQAMEDARASDLQNIRANDAIFKAADQSAANMKKYVDNNDYAQPWATSRDAALVGLLGSSGIGIANVGANQARLQAIMQKAENDRARIEEKERLALEGEVDPHKYEAKSVAEAEVGLGKYIEPEKVRAKNIYDGYKEEAADIREIGKRTVNAIGGYMRAYEWAKDPSKVKEDNAGFAKSAKVFMNEIAKRGPMDYGLGAFLDSTGKTGFSIAGGTYGYQNQAGEIVAEPVDLRENERERNKVIADIRAILINSPLVQNPANKAKLMEIAKKQTLSGQKVVTLNPESVFNNMVSALAEYIFESSLASGKIERIPELEQMGYKPVIKTVKKGANGQQVNEYKLLEAVKSGTQKK